MFVVNEYFYLFHVNENLFWSFLIEIEKNTVTNSVTLCHVSEATIISVLGKASEMIAVDQMGLPLS